MLLWRIRLIEMIVIARVKGSEINLKDHPVVAIYYSVEDRKFSSELMQTG